MSQLRHGGKKPPVYCIYHDKIKLKARAGTLAQPASQTINARQALLINIARRGDNCYSLAAALQTCRYSGGTA